MTDIAIEGGKELAKLLKELPSRIEKKIMRAAMRQGANVIMKQARQNAPVDSGDLRKSIRTSTRARKGNVEASVKAGNKKAYYSHMVEFGTAVHGISGRNGKMLKFTLPTGQTIFTKRVLHLGARARPFMRPAFDARNKDAISKVVQEIRSRLPEEIKKAKNNVR